MVFGVLLWFGMLWVIFGLLAMVVLSTPLPLLPTPLPLLLLPVLYAIAGGGRAAGAGVDGAEVVGWAPPKMAVVLRTDDEGTGVGAVPFGEEPSEDERRAKLLVVFTAVNC